MPSVANEQPTTAPVSDSTPISTAAVSIPSSLTVAPAAPVFKASVPFTFKLTMADPIVRLNLRVDDDFVGYFALFESVKLEGCDVSITLLPGINRSVVYCFTAHSDLNSGFLRQPVAGFLNGATHTSVREDFSLPANHPFGRELKGLNVGNPSPTLCIKYRGGTVDSTTKDVRGRGIVHVSFSGAGVFAGFAA